METNNVGETMKCEHCSAEWTVRNSQSKMTKCPFCGAELVQVTEVRTEEVTMASVLTEIIARFGEETVTDKRRCISLFQDLAPDLEYEQRLLRMALQTFDIGAYFVSCAEQDREKNIRKAIRATEGMLAKEAQKTVITSFVAAFGWDERLLADYFKENLNEKKEKKTPLNAEPKQPANPAEVKVVDAETLYHEGENYYNAKNYVKAMEYFRKAAEQGHASAQNDVGFMYRNGYGVAKNEAEAVTWYRRAAEQGYTTAQYNLGVMYDEGRGVVQNDAEAATWYRRAAEQGHVQAQYTLGQMCDNGRGVAQNYTEAAKWYRKAAEQGLADAQNDLGVSYANGEGVTQNYTEAAKWYHKAAEQGQANAQCNLGWMYVNGRGVPQDYAEAMKWYCKAAEQGVTNAQYNLGWMYVNGHGVTQNDAEAVKWYRKAAEQGLADAQSSLGWMYANGRGVPQDYAEAMKWYCKAVEQGHENAQNNLGFMYLEGTGVAKNFDTAMINFQKADAQGNMYAPWNIGRMYENGWGVQKNLDMAKQWYEKAAERGHPDAKNKLEELKKSGCFITTAVCGSLNKPDDCDELMTMRWYRDKLKTEDADMAALIQEYYRIAPQIVKEIDGSVNAEMVYRGLWKNYISNIYQNIRNENYKEAKLQYTDMMVSLCGRYHIPLAEGIDLIVEKVRDGKD